MLNTPTQFLWTPTSKPQAQGRQGPVDCRGYCPGYSNPRLQSWASHKADKASRVSPRASARAFSTMTAVTRFSKRSFMRDRYARKNHHEPPFKNVCSVKWEQSLVRCSVCHGLGQAAPVTLWSWQLQSEPLRKVFSVIESEGSVLRCFCIGRRRCGLRPSMVKTCSTSDALSAGVISSTEWSTTIARSFGIALESRESNPFCKVRAPCREPQQHDSNRIRPL